MPLNHLIPSFLSLVLTLPIAAAAAAAAADNCSPVTWENTPIGANTIAQRAEPTPRSHPTYKQSPSVARIGEPMQAGDINCRYPGATEADVDGGSCARLAEKYGIAIEKFYVLNPEVGGDCGGVEAWTEYCVAGFIEPLRATNGRCGPPNNGATCRGTAKQCCNSETWMCGDSDEDCAPGTCYEGVCHGDRVYSTDGTCGRAHGDRRCAGKWGDCCDVNGRCGTGSEFCGVEVCQAGNCETKDDLGIITDDGNDGVPRREPLPWLAGNTTDGSCGGELGYVCNIVYGMCCNREGRCGSREEDCGEGCQPQYGNCSIESNRAEEMMRFLRDHREL